MSITSDELNFLVYRYLQESGFVHSAFTFAYESLIGRSSVAAADVPPGALINFLQKGLQYVEIEREIEAGDHAEEDSKVPTAASLIQGSKGRAKLGGEDGDLAPMDEGSEAEEIPPSEVTVLKGHQSEVFICAWNPCADLLASGSGDSTSRIWTIPQGVSGLPASATATAGPLVLKHTNANNQKSKDVTTLDWNADGRWLATGSYDGQARIWNANGELKSTLTRHTGPIFSLKWSKDGAHLLSGSVDKTAVVWDVETGSVKQQFEFHNAPTLDVDWRDADSFATCSTDKMIHLCQLGQSAPLVTFRGHKDEVNAIKWNPSGSLLASCSDDFTAKVWSPAPSFHDQGGCVQDFSEHTKEIYTIKWSPTGEGSANPNKRSVLATASFDHTIKLWDAEMGRCVHTLVKHTDPVYSVAFSPDGQYLASGSFDRCLHIWSVKDGRVVKTYKGGGGIFEVCWNSTGTKFAASFSNNTVAVLDFRK